MYRLVIKAYIEQFSSLHLYHHQYFLYVSTFPLCTRAHFYLPYYLNVEQDAPDFCTALNRDICKMKEQNQEIKFKHLLSDVH